MRFLPISLAFATLAISLAQTSAAEVAPRLNVLQDDGASGKNELLEPLSFRDLTGTEHASLPAVEPGAIKADVFLFLSTECPVALQYTERLKNLAEEFASGVRFFGVFSNGHDSAAEIRAHQERVPLPFPFVPDPSGKLARAFDATMTPQVFVLNAAGKIAYQGAIDDHRYTSRVKESFLRAALQAIGDGKPPETQRAQAFGCGIHLSEVARMEEVTYAEHIAPILQNNCQTCHRPGQVAPFALLDYKDARNWSEEITAYTAERLMPPWKAAPGFGEFKNERSLSERHIQLIARWHEDGAPEGDPAKVPPPREFSDEWILGEPDLVVEMPEEYVLAPEGEDDYRHFIVPTDFGRDIYMKALDVRPGNYRAVHHVIVYVDTSGRARELDAADPGPGYTNFGGPGFEPASMLGGWAPGTYPNLTPEGTGTLLPAGGDIVMQVHYYRTGVEERDQTKVGFYFTEGENPRRLEVGAVLNDKFTLPPGEKRHEVRASERIRRDVELVSVYPHMHLLGTEMKAEAALPNGDVIPLIWIKNWDFNWQGDYFFKEIIPLPAGSRIRLTAYYDNSAGNPNNPHDPPTAVRWGDKTTDEMCLLFFNFLYPEKDEEPEGEVAATVVNEQPTGLERDSVSRSKSETNLATEALGNVR